MILGSTMEDFSCLQQISTLGVHVDKQERVPYKEGIIETIKILRVKEFRLVSY
ncbi:hypothetical protein SLEP1_g10858 [Rubroshorea leprosula]|uniref:Uncharacterized protein n=1 Tax=Rubroshorea leprosula TaxID=152421 RepID=A0AAV5IDX8_9ROSI|nr:hypothetical protein SLEP1_g10858 [Rubroshorea leprosula]